MNWNVFICTWWRKGWGRDRKPKEFLSSDRDIFHHVKIRDPRHRDTRGPTHVTAGNGNFTRVRAHTHLLRIYDTFW